MAYLNCLTNKMYRLTINRRYIYNQIQSTNLPQVLQAHEISCRYVLIMRKLIMINTDISCCNLRVSI